MADDGNAGTGSDEGQKPKLYTEEEVTALRAGVDAKNRELLAKQAELKGALEPFKGLDPEKVKAALEFQDQHVATQQREKGDWEAREKSLRDGFTQEHHKVVTPLQERVASLEAQLFEATSVREATEELVEQKGNPHLLLPLLRAELVKVQVDGREVTGVRGPDGKARYHPTTGALVTVKDRVLELKADTRFAGAFEGSPGSGGGARPSSGGPKTYAKLSDFGSDKEKADFIGQHGLDAFERIAFGSSTQPASK